MNRRCGPGLAAVLLCGAVTGVGCGKKGPPLAPLVHIPAAVEQLSARRIGDDVYVTLTVPTRNIDASTPADVNRVELYGATALTPPPRGRFLEIGELVETVPVAPPNVGQAGTRPSSQDAVSPAFQGGMIVVQDALSAEDLVARTLPAAATRARPVAPSPVAESRGALRRFYFALAFSDRGRPGPPGNVFELLLTPLPEAPTDVQISYDADMLSIAWQPSGGLLGFLMNQALEPEPSPLDDVIPDREVTPGNVAPFPGSPSPALSAAPATSGPSGPTRYNIYRELEPDPALPPAPQGVTSTVPRAILPMPLNPSPLDALSFTDGFEFELERCYIIRAVRGGGSNLVEGHGSERRCVKPVDTFPPAAPAGLSAVAAAGSISLIWEANVEDDVTGYLILRGGSADATLLPLTTSAVPETRFTDLSVTPGERYVYAVVAVDGRVPLPNVSAESERVEETAR